MAEKSRDKLVECVFCAESMKFCDFPRFQRAKETFFLETQRRFLARPRQEACARVTVTLIVSAFFERFYVGR
jgi:hypothetical protein